MRSGWWRGLFAAAVLALLVPAGAVAYERSEVPGTGICLFWDSRNLPWVLNERGSADLPIDTVEREIQRSFDAWEAVECSDVRFFGQGRTSEDRVGYDTGNGTDNLIVFRRELCDDVVADEDPCWDDYGCANAHDCWGFSEGVIAVTTTSYREDTGEIIDADIEFNDAAFDFTTGGGEPCSESRAPNCVSTDLRNTATHEIGHLLGIDHSPVHRATMYASAPLGETAKRSLHEDDIDAICAIYPAGEPVNVCDEAYGKRLESGGGGGCSAGGGAIGAWAALAIGLLWRRQRPPA